MDARKIVWKHTATLLLGQVICLGMMYAVFALLKRFDITVLLGGLVGTLLSTLNFFFMAVGTSLAADKAENQDVKGGQKLIRLSYASRTVILFVVLFACIKSKLFNLFALLLPLVFVRPILMFAEFFRKPGEKST